MLDVTLFTKDPCPLCDDLKELLQSLSETYPHQLTEVDITKDNDLNARYRFQIPVLEIGGKRLNAPIALPNLTKFLREANE